MASTAARAYFAVGLLAIAVNAALGGNNGLYQGVGLAAAGAIFLGTALHRPRAWRAWVGIGASQLLFSLGDLAFGAGATSPSFADAFYLVGDAVLIGAVAALVFGTGSSRNLSASVDAVLIAMIVGVCGWTFFAASGIAHGSFATVAIGVAYPVADLVLLALLARLAFVRGVRSPAYWLLFAAIAPLFLADGGYIVPSVNATYTGGGWLDVGWLASYSLLAVAALHPSMTRIVEPQPEVGPSLPVRRAFVLGIGLIAVPASVMLERVIGKPVHDVGDEIAMVLIAVAVVVRGSFLVRDLERLRRKAEASESRFRLVFERAPIGISLGRDGIMSETNPALQEMLGYTGEELSGMHYTDVTHPDDRALTEQLELDAHRRDAFALDKRYRRKDGSVIDAHVHVALDVEAGLGISLIEDVSGRHELEQQLRQSQKMDSIGKLAGGIAHDFNNLMTAVMGYSDLLLHDPQTTASGQARAEAIRDSAVRASELTRQLLAFSRQQVLEAQDIDLRDVVRRMDTLLQRVIGDAVRLRTRFGAEPVIVRADKTQLEQVVMNLAVNARDAMPTGGTLTIAVLSDGESAVLSVADTGIGMDGELTARIFEPFFTTKPLADASGLGLSTVHGIVGQSGGTIDVESTPGEGTVFTIRLPVAVPAPEPALLPEGPAAATLVD